MSYVAPFPFHHPNLYGHNAESRAVAVCLVHNIYCYFVTSLSNLLRHSLFCGANASSVNLMLFWPCIMNWLNINYQLDALIIIYS